MSDHHLSVDVDHFIPGHRGHIHNRPISLLEQQCANPLLLQSMKVFIGGPDRRGLRQPPLRFVDQVFDVLIPCIKAATNLTSLSLYSVSDLRLNKAFAVPFLEGTTNLQSLCFFNATPDVFTADTFKSLASVRRLDISFGSHEQMHDLQFLAQVPHLEALSVTGRFLRASASVFGALPRQLSELTVKVNGSSLAGLEGLVSLTQLCLSTRHNNIPLDQLGSLTRLTRMRLSQLGSDSHDLRPLRNLVNLVNLELIDAGKLRHLDELTGVTRLLLEGCGPPCDLPANGRLKVLIITNTTFKPNSMRSLALLTRLRRLDLSRCGGLRTGNALYLTALTGLTALNLDKTSPDINSMTAVKKALKGLKILSLKDCRAARALGCGWWEHDEPRWT